MPGRQAGGRAHLMKKRALAADNSSAASWCRDTRRRPRNCQRRVLVSSSDARALRPVGRAWRGFRMEEHMAIKTLGKGLALATALVATVAFTAPTPAQARISTGAAIGLGLGAFALGTAIGSAPYYG